MTRVYIPRALRERVAEQARHRCGYCLTPAALIGAPLEMEHIIPVSLGGPTVEDNLWLACSLCNAFKGNRIATGDPLSGETVPLFDPRRNSWTEHFAWTSSGDRIVGLTRTGRATIVALSLNRPELLLTRQAWIAVGWHPPRD